MYPLGCRLIPLFGVVRSTGQVRMLELYHAGAQAHCITVLFDRVDRRGSICDCVTRAFSCHFIGLLFRGGPAARGELPNQRGSAGMEALRLRCAQQSVQAGRSSREARLPGQQSASRHACALWACRLLAGDAGAAARLRGTSTFCQSQTHDAPLQLRYGYSQL